MDERLAQVPGPLWQTTGLDRIFRLQKLAALYEQMHIINWHLFALTNVKFFLVQERLIVV